MKDIVIYGAGGFAREVSFLIEQINFASDDPPYRFLGYLSDSEDDVGKKAGKDHILGGREWLVESDYDICCVFAVGTPSILNKLSSDVAGLGKVEFPNLVHPSTIWHRERIEIGNGNIITAGSIFTTDIKIGSFNIFNLNCTYGHDVVVEDCCVINPGCNISGNVTIGSESMIGTGATVLQGQSIGRGSVVGAGAVVIKDVEQGATVVRYTCKTDIKVV